MRTYLGVLCVLVCGGALGTGAMAQEADEVSPASAPPAWAYPVNPGGAQRAPDDGTARSVPGSSVRLTVSETRDLFNVPDWHPDEHPPMPRIVSNGRNPEVRACGYCHLPNGQGRPENAGVAGLPASYILQQMADYKAGLRRSSEPDMGPPRAMLAIGESVTEEEARIAAQYFAGMDFRPWIRVVEADRVPRTFVSGAMYVAAEDGGMEPIGKRIVEIPENLERTELRDDTSGFVAYVPPGSIRRGEALATGSSESRTACGVCHGPALKGLGPVPPLAGRSPSYTVRQLYDFQSGARRGLWSDLMQDVVRDLTLDDLIALGAYTASLAP